MRRVDPTILLAIVLGTLAASSRADEPTETQDKAERTERMAFMQRTFAEFELFTKDAERPCDRSEGVLRYSNPVRNFFSDGVSFLWLEGKRPVAAATISIRGRGDVWRECTSFSHQPLRCVHEGQDAWTPKAGNLINQPFPKAPKPATSSKLRQIQMRRLARRFAVIMQESATKPDETKALRLLAKPLHTWSKPEAGIVEGALFAFSETTDPEAFLIIESVQPKVDAKEPADLVWQYSLARMTSRPLVFRLDGEEVVTLKGYWANPRSKDDPYAGARLGKYESPADGDMN